MPTFMNFTSEDTIDGVPSLGGVKRTARNTRRVNTAERRATHNAVERARRETLNGRFLDLAALLPNLNTLRRPSKSTIVNSSIAHLNASQRHRILAAQQLRMIKDETDALRHEVNQWRARAGVAFVEEPVRGDAFGIILSGELEFEQGDLLDGYEEYEDEDSSAGNDSGRRYSVAEPLYADVPADNYGVQPPFAHPALHSMHPHAFASQGYPAAHPVVIPSAHYYGAAPTIADHALQAAYENPTIGYEHAAVAHPELNAHLALEKQQQHMLHAEACRQGQPRTSSW